MNHYYLVAQTTSPKMSHSLSPKTKELSRLGPRWNLEAEWTTYCWHLDVITQGRLCEIDGKVVEDIIPPTLEEGVFFNRENYIEVA